MLNCHSVDVFYFDRLTQDITLFLIFRGKRSRLKWVKLQGSEKTFVFDCFKLLQKGINKANVFGLALSGEKGLVTQLYSRFSWLR